jgi:hypothetical protein
MTTQVPTNAYIVSGSVYNVDSVEQIFINATKTFNSQGVPITFILNTQQINTYSSTNKDLLSITIPGDPVANEQLMYAIGAGVLSSGGHVPLVDTSGATFNYIFTNQLYEKTESLNGIQFKGTTTAIISQWANSSTTDHETGHTLGLDDLKDINGNIVSPSGNLMGYGRYGTQLDQNQINTARDYLTGYPHKAVLPSGGTSPDRKNR